MNPPVMSIKPSIASTCEHANALKCDTHTHRQFVPVTDFMAINQAVGASFQSPALSFSFDLKWIPVKLPSVFKEALHYCFLKW